MADEEQNEHPLEEPSDEQQWLEWLEKEHESRFPEPLPAEGDVVFKASADPDRVQAQKIYPPQQTYLSGYERAADCLFEEVAKRTKKEKQNRDVLDVYPIITEHWFVYPIYFLYRHLIELSLKDILRSQHEQKPLPPEHAKLIDASHEPLTLWEAAKPGVMNIAGKALKNSTPAFESMLREIQMHDPNAEAGRFHLKRVGKKQTKRMVATFEGLTPIDVVILRDSVKKILNYIRWIWGLYEENEMRKAEHEAALEKLQEEEEPRS
jgi:hypothetical protein